MWRFGIPLVFLAFGCSGGGDAAPGGTAADSAEAVADLAADTAGVTACDLVTAGMLTSIVGETFRAGRTTNDYMGVSQCKWDRVSGDGDVTVSLHRKGNFENYARVPGATPVSGLGDEAVWNEETRQLAVRSGEAVMSVSFLFEPVEREWAEEIARASVDVLTNEGQATSEHQGQ